MTNRYSLNRTLGLAIVVIALVSLIGTALVFSTLQRLQDATLARGRANQVIIAVGRFEKTMLDQETGLRGYLLTGRFESLAPYVAGRAALDPILSDLHALIAPNSDEAVLLDRAIVAARDWQAKVGDPVVRDMAHQATQASARNIEASGLGKHRFDELRQQIAAIERAQRTVLAEQDAIVQSASRLATIALWTAALVTLLICIGAGLALARVVTGPLADLADAMTRLVRRDTDVRIPSLEQQNEVGAMARAVEIFRTSLIELDRTSLLRVTADTLPAMVGYVDATRRIGLLNGEFARWFDLGVIDVSQVIGEPLDQVFKMHSFPGATDELVRALAGEEVRFAVQLAAPGGELRDVEGYFRPHRAPGGPVLGVVTLFTDVSDRKDIDRRLRSQAHDLRRSNEELEQFAYVASHDLKAPLRGIENLAGWIEEDLADVLTGDTRTNMNLLKSRVLRLERLLDDLLAYSRAGRDDSVTREVDSHALVEELAVLISPPEGFTIEAAPDLPTLVAAHAAFAQVLQNLMSNAIKHHPDPANGHVRVEAEAQGPFYEFRVCDDGPGIAEQYRERVFGMFQTLRPRDEVEGSGMGLAIVRKLIERQGGQIWLNDRPGGGLIAHFTWPAIAGVR